MSVPVSTEAQARYQQQYAQAEQQALSTASNTTVLAHAPPPPVAVPVPAAVALPVGGAASGTMVAPATRLMQVIFVVDATFLMRPHWSTMLQQYVLPILMMLRSQMSAAAPPFVCEFALVMFRDVPPFGDFVVRCSKFVRDSQSLYNWCKALAFRGASGGGRAHVAAALCAALQLGKERPADQRCIVLFTANVPRTLSCGMCDAGGDAAQHCNAAAQRRVCLSVVSPRKISELEELFTAADPHRQGSLDQVSFILQPTELAHPAKNLSPSHSALFRALTMIEPPPVQRVAAPVAAAPLPPLDAQRTDGAKVTLAYPMAYAGKIELDAVAGLSNREANVQFRVGTPNHWSIARLLFQVQPVSIKLEQIKNVPPEQMQSMQRKCLPLMIVPDDDVSKALLARLRDELQGQHGQQRCGMLAKINQRMAIVVAHSQQLAVLILPDQAKPPQQAQQQPPPPQQPPSSSVS